ncbi:helix-turn-helix domain-containing protein [Halarsenatibacter silvermanii]|uniref:Helix-turn-helix domain-containing protein n=1 Tax=Halarsenatibacter silvermanii TaxID=321763 RepID=A0A1G9RUR0_9FIRM|nr:helix-turn-helix transcriptional regulator [Halarsenatibacter silvermanii]SDM26780.1 Helix-turn-helix domain-containing protein [Halarsenatibacter silvermanii]
MKRLAQERKKKEMSQSDLAFELRIQPSTLSKIENGRLKPYDPVKNKLENFFGMEIEELLEDVETEEI